MRLVSGYWMTANKGHHIVQCYTSCSMQQLHVCATVHMRLETSLTSGA